MFPGSGHVAYPTQDGNDVDVELEFDYFFDGYWNSGGRVVSAQKIIGFLVQNIITVDGDFCHRLRLADQLDQLVEFFL